MVALVDVEQAPSVLAKRCAECAAALPSDGLLGTGRTLPIVAILCSAQQVHEKTSINDARRREMLRHQMTAVSVASAASAACGFAAISASVAGVAAPPAAFFGD